MILKLSLHCIAHFGERAIVPEVALVREAVADESKLALLDVLLDGVPGTVYVR